MIKTFDLFAGIGGFRNGSETVFKKNKIKNLSVGWSEIDKYCQKTYASNYNFRGIINFHIFFFWVEYSQSVE